MLINQELLRTFLAAADARTFGEAAANRHVTKSAISQQVKTLEAQLRVPLFERVGRLARLTESGVELATLLRREFAIIDDALEAVSKQHTEVRGEIRIGAPRPFARVWLRPRLAKLLALHEKLRARVVFGTPSELERLLLERSLDLAVLVRPPESVTLASAEVFKERFAAYGAPSYLRRRGTPRTADEFKRHRWIVFDDDLPMHAVWWRAMFGSRAAVGVDAACCVASLDEMLALAEVGVGLTILPDYFAREAVDRGAIVELSPPRRDGRALNTISLAWRRSAVVTARFDEVRRILLEDG